MENDIIYLIAGIICIFVLIFFFVLCNNVSDILKSTTEKRAKYWFDEWQKYLFYKDKEKALFALQQAVWREIKFRKSSGNSKEVINNSISKLLDKYTPEFEKLGGNVGVLSDIIL